MGRPPLQIWGYHPPSSPQVTAHAAAACAANRDVVRRQFGAGLYLGVPIEIGRIFVFLSYCYNSGFFWEERIQKTSSIPNTLIHV